MRDRTQAFVDRLVIMKPARREELVARALAAGHSREYADRIYDVATEERVDPAVAFELVLSGVGVRQLGPAAPDNWKQAQVEAQPAWIERPPAAGDAVRERRLRLTFRRLRHLVEQENSLELALRAFMREPDVGDVEY
ncbi:MAG: hypothetical protein ACT4O1_02525 [Gemmatimonadota bacterium]